MSRIDDMIRQMCPDGVNHEPLSALGVWKGGGTPSRTRTDYWTRREIPWVTPKDMGDIELKGAEDWISSEATIDSTTPLIAGPSLAVVARSSILKRTLPVSIVPFDSTFNQDMKVLRPRKDIDVRFILHLLRSRSSDILRTSSKHGGSVDSLVMNRFFSYAIPIPPTAIQVELVRLLEKLSRTQLELETGLKAELEARRQQYAYYRNHLIWESNAPRVALGNVGALTRGRRFTRNDIADQGVPAIHYGEIYTTYGISTRKTISHVASERAQSLRYAEPGDVIIAGVGETVEEVGIGVAWLGNHPVAYHDDSFALHHQQDPRYISHVLRTSDYHRQKDRFVSRAKVKRLSARGIEQITIPLPPLSEQRRIADILGNFDSLVSDISSGIPAEIEARRQQYEYYRDRLLTFPEKAV